MYDIYHYAMNKFGDKEKAKIFSRIKGELDNGLCISEVYRNIKQFKDINKWLHSSSKSSNNDKYSVNLLKSGEMYYHLEFALMAKTPKSIYDVVTGEITTPPKPKFFLEMKASYSVNEVFNYLSKKTNLVDCLKNPAKTKGGIAHLLKKMDIDTLMFTIDSANLYFRDTMYDCQNILEVSEYEGKARHNYHMKVADLINIGITKEVLKERD